MKLRKRYRANAVAAICVVVAGVFLLLPIPIPDSIDTWGRIVPAKEWIIMRDAAGRITAAVNNRVANSTESLFIHENERDDAVVVDIDPRVLAKGLVARGDSVGRLVSADAQRELAALEGELAQAGAASRVSATGEKAALVAEAERRVEQSRTMYAGHQRIVERMRQLSERGIISRQEFELVENEGDGYRADIRVAEAALESVRSGAKPAEQEYARAGERSLDSQIRALREKLKRFVFLAPFDGVVLRRPLSDTLFHLASGDGPVVVLPVPWSERDRLRAGQEVDIHVPGTGGSLTARICGIGNVVQTVAGRQVFIVTAAIDAGAGSLPLGLQARCSVPCAPLTPLQAVGRIIASVASPGAWR
jgi:hypothetical protein